MTVPKNNSTVLTKKQLFYEVFGWYGALAIVSSYGLVSFKVIGVDSFMFHFLNLTGPLGVMLISYVKQTYQPVALNAFRVAIATIAIIGLIR